MKRWAVLVIVFLLVFVSIPMTSIAQEKENEKTIKTKVGEIDKTEIKDSVDRALAQLDAMDIDLIIKTALESSRIALEEIDIDAQIRMVIQDININEIVRAALETAQIALENVDINAEVDRALVDVDIAKIIDEAMEAVEEALDEANIEETVRKALEAARKDIDIEIKKVKRQKN